MEGRKRRGSSFLLAFALLAGVALGFCFGVTTSTTPEQAKEEREKTEKRPLADAGEAASLKALRARVADLERQLAARTKDDAQTNEAAAVSQQNAPGPMNGPRDWLEKLKKDDPERYTQMTNNFARMRRRREERQQRNLDFLASVDTSRMSASAKKTHAALMEALAARAEMESKAHFGEMTDEERRAAVAELMESERELRRLRRAERSILFEATANTLGFEGDDAKEIVATLEEVVDATDGSPRHMPPPPGRRHPRN